MRLRLVIALAALVGCAGAPRSPTVDVPTFAPASVEASPVIEPQLPGAKCAIAGSAPSLTADALPLCGKRDAACFGVLHASDHRGARVTALHVDDAGSAELSLARGGVTVHAIVAASGLAFHAAQLSLIDQYFVPNDAVLHLDRVTGTTITASVEVRHIDASAPLRATWSCAEVSLEPPEFTLDEVMTGLGLSDTGDDVASVVAAPKLRDAPGGEVVASLRGEIVARIVERRPKVLHVVIEVDDGFLVGWVDAADFSAPQLRGRRARAPRLYQGTTHVGRKCAHAVRMLARVGADVVHVATIDPGEPFDATAARMRLDEIFDVGAPPMVDPWIPAAQLAGCAQKP